MGGRRETIEMYDWTIRRSSVERGKPVPESEESAVILNGWIDCNERLPDAVYGEEGEPPEMSEDVLACWPNAMNLTVDIAQYDHGRKQWSFPTKGFEDAHCDPGYWMPLPELPEGVTR